MLGKGLRGCALAANCSLPVSGAPDATSSGLGFRVQMDTFGSRAIGAGFTGSRSWGVGTAAPSISSKDFGTPVEIMISAKY